MSEQLDYLKSCSVAGCKGRIARYSIQSTGPSLYLTLVCTEGHTVIQRYALTETAQQRTAPKSIRTKVLGVTFKNSDGVDRQALLKHITAGEDLLIARGTLDGNSVFLVRHAIGVIGTVKRDAIRPLWDDTEPSELRAKVTQVTGGQGEKTTLGCNIEVFGPVPTVYMDPDGKDIYHIIKTCCGMQNPKEVTLEDATQMGARPCKKCGGQ